MKEGSHMTSNVRLLLHYRGIIFLTIVREWSIIEWEKKIHSASVLQERALLWKCVDDIYSWEKFLSSSCKKEKKRKKA